MYFVIADTHMGHKSILKYCNRPAGFENAVMRHWREMVSTQDVVIHLGDMSFEEEWIRRMGKLPGKKILTIGNHDRLTMDAYISFGWMPMQMLVLQLEGVRLSFSHRPLWGHPHDINIHGHEHDLHVLDDTRLYLPIALEHSRYSSVPLTESFLREIRSCVDRGHQPTTREIHQLLDSDCPISNRDFYGSRGKEEFEECRRRLRFCYELLGQQGTSNAAQGYRLWYLARKYVEGKLDKEELKKKIKEIGYCQVGSMFA